MMGPIAAYVRRLIENPFDEDEARNAERMSRAVLFNLGYYNMPSSSYYQAVKEAIKAVKRDENLPATRPRRFPHEEGITYVLSQYDSVVGLYSSFALAKGAAKLETLPDEIDPFVERNDLMGGRYYASDRHCFLIEEFMIDTKWVSM